MQNGSVPDVTTHDVVKHIGDLDAERTKPQFSYEGDGLSVSTCPESWASIARLGGTCYTLYNPDGTFYSIDPTETPRDVERKWCIDAGYVREVTGYRATWVNADSVEVHMEFYDKEPAELEACAADREGWVDTTTSLELGSKGEAYWKSAFRKSPADAGPMEVRGLLPVWYAENTTGHEGVWWHEQHDPANLSAPRGVIFQEKLDNWEIRDEFMI